MARPFLHQSWFAHSTGYVAFALFVLALLAQLPILLNPGYFSHDELQWAARAGVAGEPIPWFPWTAIDRFQYRPLTFNLWLWLSHHFFAQPYLFHAICVAWGAMNAALLFLLARSFGVRPWPAALGALSFALGPYAVFVHAWVGTLGDLIVLTCALLIGLVTVGGNRFLAQRPTGSGRAGEGASSAYPGLRALPAVAAAASFTAVGLLAKEAALTFPLLLAIAWWFDGRKGTWGLAALASGLIALAYLGLRFEALLLAPRQGAQYDLDLWHVPVRWLEYQLFPAIPPLLETHQTLFQSPEVMVLGAAALWAGLLIALWLAGPRYALLFLVGGAGTLATVLPLAAGSNQYGYLFAALTAMVVAAAWPSAPRWGRLLILILALLNLAHGAFVMQGFRAVGKVQAVFSPAVAAVAAHASDASPVRLRAAPDAAEWMFLRLTHEIPSYRGMPLGERIKLVGEDAPADYIIEADGHLTPVR